MLDTSEKEPWDLMIMGDGAAEWMLDIEYIAVFELVPIQPEPKVFELVAEVWDRIYNGKPAAIRGGNQRKPVSGRKQSKKADRKKKEADSGLIMGSERAAITDATDQVEDQNVEPHSPILKKKPLDLGALARVQRLISARDQKAYIQFLKDPTKGVSDKSISRGATQALYKSKGSLTAGLQLWFGSKANYPSLDETLQNWTGAQTDDLISQIWKTEILRAPLGKLRQASNTTILEAALEQELAVEGESEEERAQKAHERANVQVLSFRKMEKEMLKKNLRRTKPKPRGLIVKQVYHLSYDEIEKIYAPQSPSPDLVLSSEENLEKEGEKEIGA